MNLPLFARKIKSKLARKLYAGTYGPGHFYSPIPDIKDVKKNESTIFQERPLGDVDLNKAGQLDFLKARLNAARQYPFPAERRDGFRYYYNNTYFNVTDSLALFLTLDHFKPKRIIEVGSGFSSACILDTFDKHLTNKAELIFIEPNPERLKSLLNAQDLQHCKLIENRVQRVEPEVFSALQEGDILFIDSSHVSKVGSDLNYLMFDVLPLLQSGVLIHFHDICYPFEYPKEWIYDGIYWNEAYLVRAFLMNNDRYEIILFNHFVSQHYRSWLDQNMPAFQSGGSLWLRKK